MATRCGSSTDTGVGGGVQRPNARGASLVVPVRARGAINVPRAPVQRDSLGYAGASVVLMLG